MVQPRFRTYEDKSGDDCLTILVISDPGSYIGRTKDQFRISFGVSDKPVSYVPAVKVEGMLVDAKITISSGAFELFRTYGIFVIWQSYLDDGMILQPFNSHGSVEVRKSQYGAIEDERGVVVAAKICYAACKNKINVLKRLQRYTDRLEPGEDLKFMISKLEELTTHDMTYKRINHDLRQYLMNLEAQVAKRYYAVLSPFLEALGWNFDKRSRRPAEDEFNALLNYSYAVLRGKLTQYLAISGLDNYAGFLHTDRSGRQSLALDVIEEFRQIAVDEVLVKLILREEMHPDDFEHGDGITITPKIKKVLFPALLHQLNMKFRGKSLQNWQIHQGRALASYLMGHELDYRPFLLKVTDSWD